LGLLLNATEAAESGELMTIRAACDALPAFTPDDLITRGLAATTWYGDQILGRLNTAITGPWRITTAKMPVTT
jgi:hypothetical protein